MEGGHLADTHVGNTLLMAPAVTMKWMRLLLTAGSLDTRDMEYTGADEQPPRKIALQGREHNANNMIRILGASVMPRDNMWIDTG